MSKYEYLESTFMLTSRECGNRVSLDHGGNTILASPGGGAAQTLSTANLLAVQISVDTITALGLLNSGCYCIALSMGQLPSQIVQRQVLYLGKPQDRTGSPVRITVLLRRAFPYGSKVSFDNV
ncbi:MAG: hypothetical protein HC862_09055 [Scytonema sp. RU_4_4]|nr:hypothetical protein [Scytonema sp. RU_4_4]